MDRDSKSCVGTLQIALAEVQLPAGFTHSTDMNHFQKLCVVVPYEHQSTGFQCESMIYKLCLHQHCMLFLVFNSLHNQTKSRDNSRKH